MGLHEDVEAKLNANFTRIDHGHVSIFYNPTSEAWGQASIEKALAESSAILNELRPRTLIMVTRNEANVAISATKVTNYDKILRSMVKGDLSALFGEIVWELKGLELIP